ncbi:methyltransferase domain-containing protein [Dyella sp.]|uniref:methyltransferase domain-containing protein n=1 Tax=Dyella sp. TaxID=1869338 RepID=UPI003F7DE5FE
MSAACSDIYASAPLRQLLADEARDLLPELQRCTGDHGLLVSAAMQDRPPALPLLSCWTHLKLAGDRYVGDLHARVAEPLPFVDDAFELVILRHALEASALPQSLLEEGARVLSPGGLLVLSGVHPLSLWTPWMVWHGRGQSLRLRMPLQVGEWLRRHAMQVECVRRVGHAVPGGGGTPWLTEAIGGGYVLLARKRRQAVTPIRLVPRALRAPADAGLAPGARRNTACAAAMNEDRR